MAKFKVPIANGGGKVAILDTEQPGRAVLGVNVYYQFPDGTQVLINPEDVLNGAPTKVVQQIIQAPGSSNVGGMDGGTFKASSYRLAARGSSTSTSGATQTFAGSGISYVVYAGSSAQYVIDAYAVASGTNTYTATLAPVPTGYTTNGTFKIKFTNANTGAATLNLNALGAKAIQLNGAALTSGAIPAAATLDLLYDGTQFQIVGGLSSGGSLPMTTKGDLCGYSTLAARIPVGATGQTIFSDSTQTLGVAWANSYMPPRYGLHRSTDLTVSVTTAGTVADVGIVGVGGGGGTRIAPTGRPGVYNLSTGTILNGNCRAGFGFQATTTGSAGSIAPGDGPLEAIVYFKTGTLSDATNSYLITAGWNDSTTPLGLVNLIGMFYRHDVNAGVPPLVVYVAGVAQTSVAGTTALVANTAYRYRWVINAAYTQVDMYMRNITTNAAEVLEATYTGAAGTTLPANTVEMGLICDIWLSTAGGASRSVEIDGFEFTYLLTNQR